jgi:hypothetical protein
VHPLRVLAPVVLILLVLVAAASIPAVRHQLALSFTREPTQYSELYFTKLPRAKAGRLTVGFRIANRGDHTIRYRYTVRIAPGLTPGAVIDRGTQVVGANQVVGVAVTARVRPSKIRRIATVLLSGGSTRQIRIHARLGASS